MSEKVNRNTAYGPVNGQVLDELCLSFDTRRILDAVDAIDDIRYRICEPDQMRQEFLQLHGLAMNMIHGEGGGAPRADDPPIWELADELDMEIFRWVEKLEGVMETLQELARLIPEEEGDDEDE